MKNTIKLSLVAAVAVTSLSANTLENAIKDVKFGGSVEYRMESRSVTNTPSTTGENAKIVVNIKTKVNDSLSFASQGVLNTQGKDAKKVNFVEKDNTTSTAFAPVSKSTSSIFSFVFSKSSNGILVSKTGNHVPRVYLSLL